MSSARYFDDGDIGQTGDEVVDTLLRDDVAQLASNQHRGDPDVTHRDVEQSREPARHHLGAVLLQYPWIPVPVPATVTLAQDLGESRGIELADPLRGVGGDGRGRVLQ